MSLLSELRAEKGVCLGLARYYAPIDTGNLRYNAIQTYDTSDGFVINYDLSSAYYAYFLEEGTRYSVKHQGFIANFTYPAIASYLFAKYSARNIDLVRYYEQNAEHGNYDVYKNEQNRYGNSQLYRREQRLLESKLANMVVYGHMSNAYGWSHNQNYEIEQPDLNQRF